ncbi:hypothetical protein ACFXQA_08325 [Microbacterium sp. P07]|uniref:hypothetical protein n=1 Tax=Microbacterium sp. P07 TaxID=3366952 RepID=UPI003744D79D
MNTSSTPASTQSFTDDALVLERLETLLGPASRRQLWLLFVNADRTLAEVILPCEGLPADPEATVLTDNGLMTHADALSNTLAHLTDEFGFAEVILVWERPGGPAVGADERRWGGGLAEYCGRRGVILAGQFLAHDGGIRRLEPGEYAR